MSGSGFGFSFLDASHKEDPPAGKRKTPSWLGGGQDNQPLGSSSSNQDSLYTVGAWAQAPPAASFRQQRTAIEKQADVIRFLKERPDRKPATARDILAGTGIDLEIADVEVRLHMCSPTARISQCALDKPSLLFATADKRSGQQPRSAKAHVLTDVLLRHIVLMPRLCTHYYCCYRSKRCWTATLK
jgi:hypothetical protein